MYSVKKLCVIFIFLFIFILNVNSIYSGEYGFLLREDLRSVNFSVDTGSTSVKTHDFYNDTKFSFWFSTMITGNTSLFGRLSFEALNKAVLSEDTNMNQWKLNPMLERFEFMYLPSEMFFLRIGRLPYTDITGMVASAHYDGGSTSFKFGGHTLEASAFYTGLVDKESAKIFLSDKDREDYFADGYFAPPHFFFSFVYNWTHNKKKSFSFSVVRQADLQKDVLMESLYILGSTSLVFGDNFNMNAGIALCSDTVGTDASNASEPDLSFSGYLNVFYRFERAFLSRAGIGMEMYYGSTKSDTPHAMRVITYRQIGYVYDPDMLRLVNIKAQYSAKLTRTFSFETSLAFFLRITNAVFPGASFYSLYINEDSGSLLLGEELVVQLVFAPLSDLSLSLGSGMFFPNAGTNAAYKEFTPVKWDVRLGLILSF